MKQVMLAISLMAAPAMAQDIVSPTDALRQLTGYTILYEDGTREAFRADGSVTLEYPDGGCIYGVVYADGPAICFEYEHQPGVARCWSVERDAQGLAVRFASGDSHYYITGIDKMPLRCAQEDLVG